MKNFISFENGSLYYKPMFFSKKQADYLFDYFLHHINWKTKKIFLYGKWIEQPRKIEWFGEKTYIYSRLELSPKIWDPYVYKIKSKLEKEFDYEWNHALLNLYETPKHYMSWHSDDEKQLGQNPILASVTFGAQRRILFCQKKKQKRKENYISLILEHGSLLLMLGETQHFWYHYIPKEKAIIPCKIKIHNTTYITHSRINITFRKIYNII